MQANRTEQNTALALTLLLHVGFLALVYLSAQWLPQRSDEAAAGKPVMATLLVSSADVARARAAMAEAQPEPTPEAEQKPPQPEPEPDPQTSEAPLQLTAQQRLDQPDTVDQEAITRLAQQQAEQQDREEQERRQRQEQIELTEDIAKAQEAERRQRLREQYEAIRREREKATQKAQGLQQLADRTATPEPRPGPTPASPRTGNEGNDNGLRSRYIAAVNATARANWNTLQAPQLVRCQVRFFQYTGGNVYKVEFQNCPYDPEAREDVERALMKTSMPYAGFEPVFSREFTMTFCYPEEACQR